MSIVTRKMVPITGRASSVVEKVLCTYVRFQKQNRKEKEEETEQQQTYQGNIIVHILRVHHLTLNSININQHYIYIHKYIMNRYNQLY